MESDNPRSAKERNRKLKPKAWRRGARDQPHDVESLDKTVDWPGRPVLADTLAFANFTSESLGHLP